MKALMPTAIHPTDDLARRLSGQALIRRDEPLAKRTTLRVGGLADVYVEPASEQDLQTVLSFCREHKLAFFMLGRGSNLLVKDGGFRGVVICLAHPYFCRIECAGHQLRCGAGAKLKAVAVEARRNSLAGLEFLEGIPGSVGGALRMNAGAMGGAMLQVVESVRLMDFDGNVHEGAANEMSRAYRNCATFKTHIALAAVLRGEPGSREHIERQMTEFSQKRWNSQPSAPSAGCIFKNPSQALSAGQLIDEAGLKGARVGGAAVSGVHGNFIINEGTATARDVLELIELIRSRVKAARGIDLQTEVEIVGDDVS